ANVPEGAEVIVSSAIAPDNPEIAGRRVKRRGELLAELVELRPAIVVAGAHGKTTTAGMIAFCFDRLGADPAFLIGGEIPQLGGNARAGEGWLVAEGDESDRSLELLRPQIAALTNVELDHHATYASACSSSRTSTRARATWPPRSPTLSPRPMPSPSPGSTPHARNRSREWAGSWSSTRSSANGRGCRSHGRPGWRMPHASSPAGPG